LRVCQHGYFNALFRPSRFPRAESIRVLLRDFGFVSLWVLVLKG
jgi:hypothetical protein